jgi:serine/threonine protein kinase
MLPIAPDTLLLQRYRVLNILEQGSLGRTYLATDQSRADTYCAIEEIIPSAQLPSAVTKAKEFFKQEATLIYRLQHAQIPRFWTVFEEQDRFFLVRDDTTGKTYGYLLEERRKLSQVFSEAEIREFLLQVLPVISYIHSKGVIHRDLSPEHILLRDRDRLPVLIDFGVVREFANKLQINPPSQPIPIGQPGYAPPEQLQTGQAYPHSDLYALAVTAIVLLTGKEPSALFAGDLINWDWRKWTQIDDDFVNILGRMLSPQPKDRYQSAADVNRDLQALSIPNLQLPPPNLPNANSPSTIPTVALGGKSKSASAGTRIPTAITPVQTKSIWEKPQFFIPIGLVIALLTGIGSWVGVTQLLHRESSDPTASTPPKQIDFNNPTIPTDTSSPSPTASDFIQPELDRPIVKEGTVDANTPVRYRIAALAGQNLDIQLVSATSQTANPATISSPIASISPSPSPSTNPTVKNPPISLPSPIAPTQVLMTILSPTGAAIDAQADRVLSWRGQITTSGDYTIELRPITGLTGSSFPYKLSVAQVSTTPSPSLSPTTTESTPTPTGSTTPFNTPIPAISGNESDATPASPNPNTNAPGISPSPVPIVVPTTTRTESVSPTRTRRRRNRTTTQSSPQVQQRTRSETTTETTTTPTRTRRRNRQNTSQPNIKSSPSPAASPAVDNSGANNTPSPEPSVGIPVPPAKTTTTPAKTEGGSTTPSPGSSDIDRD